MGKPSTPTRSVLLTRHGTSEHNLNTRFYMGRSPASHLIEEGRAQALALGAYVSAQHHIGQIIASSLPRTQETAELVASKLGGVAVHLESAFWEMSKGDWEGRMPRNGVPEPSRTEWDERPYRFRFPGGESFADVARRVSPAFERWTNQFPGQQLLFVLHGDVICALLQRLLNSPEEDVRKMLVKPCSITELERHGGKWRLLRLSDDSFLRGEQ